MKPSSLDVSLSGEAPNVAIDLRGELTVVAQKSLLDAYREATERGAQNIVINFAQVDLVNSAGISLLFGILTGTQKAGQRLIFAGLTPHHQKVLTMMGFTRYSEFYGSVADAYRALKSAT
jgi:anti-anti-sigma factor